MLLKEKCFPGGQGDFQKCYFYLSHLRSTGSPFFVRFSFNLSLQAAYSVLV